MTATLGEILLAISTAMLIPVMAALLLLLLWSLYQMGLLGGELLGRRGQLRRWRAYVAEVMASEAPQALLTAQRLQAAWPGPPPEAIQRLTALNAEQILDDTQLAMERALGPLHLGLRLGPMFGLAGTLIPLGPALIDLSTGDVQSLARNLVVAFSTTVVGLVCGALCLVAHSVRQRWQAQSLSDLNHVLGRL